MVITIDLVLTGMILALVGGVLLTYGFGQLMINLFSDKTPISAQVKTLLGLMACEDKWSIDHNGWYSGRSSRKKVSSASMKQKNYTFCVAANPPKGSAKYVIFNNDYSSGSRELDPILTRKERKALDRKFDKLLTHLINNYNRIADNKEKAVKEAKLAEVRAKHETTKKHLDTFLA